MKIQHCFHLFLGSAIGGMFSTPLAHAQTARDAVVLESILFDNVEVVPQGSSLGSGGTGTLAPFNLPAQSSGGSFNIVINSGGGMSPEATAAFNRAAAQWEQYISDPITIYINANLAVLGDGILGSTSVANYYGFDPYNWLRTAMINDAADEGTNDSIVNSLPTLANLQAYIPTGTTLASTVLISQANLKALGLDEFGTAPDATITFNSNFSFDFDNSAIDPSKIDFETVAAHEIGHALGFVSSVDYINAGVFTSSVYLSPLDLFRFRNGSANDPASTSDFATFLRDLVPGSAGSQPIFDDLSTEILMSSGVTNALYPGTDGSQASHWKDNLSLGLMDPTLAYGEVNVPNASDLRALDLIGYEINFSPVPELTSLSSGALLILGALRRRRSPRNVAAK